MQVTPTSEKMQAEEASGWEASPTTLEFHSTSSFIERVLSGAAAVASSDAHGVDRQAICRNK
jgi:hypothetical protein